MNRKIGLYIFLGLFYTCAFFVYAQENQEKQLLSRLKSSKSSFERIQTLDFLHSYYLNHNLREKRKTTANFKKLDSQVLGDVESSIIKLNLSEQLLIDGDLKEFEKLFSRHLINYNFSDVVLNHRNQILKCHFYYYFGGKDYKQLIRSELTAIKKTRKNKLISESYRMLSTTFKWDKQLDSALYYSEIATDLASRSNSKIALFQALKNQGEIQKYFGNNREAITKELECIQVSNELKNDLLKSFAYRDIGFILLSTGNSDGAYLYFERALQIGGRKLDNVEVVKLSLAQALCRINSGNQKQIKSNFKNLFDNESIEKDGNLNTFKAYVQGRFFESKKNWNSAINSYNKALISFQSRKDFANVSLSKQRIGNVFLKLKKYQEAELNLNESLQILSGWRNLDLTTNDNYLLLAQIYNSTNRIKDAFDFQKIYIDNLNKNNFSREAVIISDLTESNLREEREQFINLQKASIEKEKKAKEKLESQRTRNLLITVIIALTLILALVIMYLRTKQIRSLQDQKEAEMSQALLRTQMNPHFVFNAMSVIQSYIFTHNPEKSSKFLVNFSKLMRLILENSPKEFISLELESEILEKYLNTQKLRFEERFEFEIDFDEDLIFQKAMVPPMITQPFVENAIEHGQLHTVENGKISVSASRNNDMLQIVIKDNGIGRKSSAKTKKIKTHKSMAINMTRERIEILNRKYRSNGNLTIEDTDAKTGRGTQVTILLPLKFE
jgi:tetratricopeptide (TPR) repeat protein